MYRASIASSVAMNGKAPDLGAGKPCGGKNDTSSVLHATMLNLCVTRQLNLRITSKIEHTLQRTHGFRHNGWIYDDFIITILQAQ